MEYTENMESNQPIPNPTTQDNTMTTAQQIAKHTPAKVAPAPYIEVYHVECAGDWADERIVYAKSADETSVNAVYDRAKVWARMMPNSRMWALEGRQVSINGGEIKLMIWTCLVEYDFAA